ncbi:hypothetical protein AcV7_001614 [Taiwanofungus camphoratus]|nr:hypothetical protein AcV7_001614 [Antrodia cinnamomea]
MQVLHWAQYETDLYGIKNALTVCHKSKLAQNCVCVWTRLSSNDSKEHRQIAADSILGSSFLELKYLKAAT